MFVYVRPVGFATTFSHPITTTFSPSAMNSRGSYSTS